MQGPFSAGQRLKVHWTNDNSYLVCDVVAFEFDSGDDLAIRWGNQWVHLWDGRQGNLTFIFSLDDVVFEILEPGEKAEVT